MEIEYYVRQTNLKYSYRATTSTIVTTTNEMKPEVTNLKNVEMLFLVVLVLVLYTLYVIFCLSGSGRNIFFFVSHFRAILLGKQSDQTNSEMKHESDLPSCFFLL